MTGCDVFVDVGKSGLRVEVAGDGELKVSEGRGVSPTEPGDHGALVGEEAARLIAAAGIGPIRCVIVGATTELSPPEHDALVRALRTIAPSAVIAVTDDGTLAHARRLNRAGVLLAVGTGVIAIARSQAGDLARFDGWGPLAGDRGSATAVGVAALRDAFRAVDEGRDSALRSLVAERIGPLDVVLARTVLADSQWPAHLAALAPAVGELAEHGDRDAGVILDDAATDLARTTRIAVTAAGERTVVVAGRFGESEAIRSRLRRALDGDDITVTTGLDRAVVSAQEILRGPYASWMTIDTGEPA